MGDTNNISEVRSFIDFICHHSPYHSIAYNGFIKGEMISMKEPIVTHTDVVEHEYIEWKEAHTPRIDPYDNQTIIEEKLIDKIRNKLVEHAVCRNVMSSNYSKSTTKEKCKECKRCMISLEDCLSILDEIDDEMK